MYIFVIYIHPDTYTYIYIYVCMYVYYVCMYVYIYIYICVYMPASCPTWLQRREPFGRGAFRAPNQGAESTFHTAKITTNNSSMNRIAIITTINRIAIITTINRIAINSVRHTQSLRTVGQSTLIARFDTCLRTSGCQHSVLDCMAKACVKGITDHRRWCFPSEPANNSRSSIEEDLAGWNSRYEPP